jgi:poly-gamma-glutamate capsule biosynthesis protein CapA/YwtB (metallophosphatase superfamily)
MTLTLALAGDTMLGRGVAERLRADPRRRLLDPALVEIARSADLFVLNLECCISDRGAPVRDARKPFFFRAPPVAADRLAELGVACVTLANNHVLDFGPDALSDTLAHLAAAGIAAVGAGPDRLAARSAAILTARGARLRIVAAADHPAAYAAGRARPGIAFADLARRGVPDWLREAARPAAGELVLVSVHWGPNMTTAPVPHVRAAADELEAAGATLIAGHSAHLPHAPHGRVLFDLGDFLDDYAAHRLLRNDLSLLWLVTIDATGPRRLEGVPLRLEYAYTRAADEAESKALAQLLTGRCAAVGSSVERLDHRLVFHPQAATPPARPAPSA